ncbi:transcriptional regulator protein [Methanohalobium sp.]|uniref:transcriptional regulator protein n=1 Tax=Methanohalobium sp. TaxID=2837493 RepID=UPI0025DF222C|nr:transcriptional regulator protein [Methanohalobium sp.]
MKDFEVNILDENDYKFIDTLKSLGMSRNVATALTYLSNVKRASSQEIEMCTGLRQPEVSVAMRTMSDNSWINIYNKKTAGKGRPTKIYELTTPVEDIIKHYEQKILKKNQEALSATNKLKSMCSKM